MSRVPPRRWIFGLLLVLASAACHPAHDTSDTSKAAPFTVVTFNTGTTEGLVDEGDLNMGYGAQQAEYSDLYYGDGLAWLPAVEATRAFLAEVQPVLVTFQEIFHPEACAAIPQEAQEDFICATWSEGDLTVAQQVLGEGWQVMCHLGKPDKCAAVRRDFGSFRGCDADLCLEGMAGVEIDGCGHGSRIGRGVVDRVDGGSFTLVGVHGTSGMTADDMACRRQQVEQVFLDMDGAPATSGDANLVMGDLNTDPGRLAGYDESAARWGDFVGDGLAFQFITEVGEDATPSYGGIMNIDHVISDTFSGDCWIAGLSEDHPAVLDALYFDHMPVVCPLTVR